VALRLRARPGPDEGAHVASAREELALDGRGVAVLEAGSVLRWMRDGGGTHWRQERGNVFYRVDRGGAFRLGTPAGDVSVLGTCFRVEVDPMKLERQGKIGFVAGAALSAVVAVTVYEGHVRLANGQGQVELGAGEHGLLADGTPARLPATAPPPAATVPPRLVNASPPMVTAELHELREQVAAQAEELARLKADRERQHGPAGPYVEVSKEELLARAARCELRYEIPRVLEAQPWTISENSARELGLSDTEREAMNETFAEVHASAAAQLRALYVEAGGDAQTAGKLTGQSLMGEIVQKLPRGEMQAARTRLSQERAGLVPPAAEAERTLVERVLRLMSGLGEQVERRLGERIGTERAHGLRVRKDGWEGSSRSSSSGC
jgi:hypothetical protein